MNKNKSEQRGPLLALADSYAKTDDTAGVYAVWAKLGMEKLREITGRLPIFELLKELDAPEAELWEKAVNETKGRSDASAARPARALPLSLQPSLRKHQLLELLGISKSTLYNWLHESGEYYDPTFPKPVYWGKGKTPYWLNEEVAVWIDAQAKKRDA